MKRFLFHVCCPAREDRADGEPLFSSLADPFSKRRDEPGFPGTDLDRVFREITWRAVIGNPLTGVTDRDRDGIADPPDGKKEKGPE